MRLSHADASLSLLLLLPTLTAAASSLDCKQILEPESKKKYDFSPLKGPHSVNWITHDDPATTNFTFTLDICNPLKRVHDDDPEVKQCASGANICGIKYETNGETTIIEKVVAIAGNFASNYNRYQDAKWSLLKNSDSPQNKDKDGLRLEMNGGRYKMDDRKGTDQRALIDFICNKDKEGVEGLADVDEHFKTAESKRSPDDDDKYDDKGDGKDDDKDENGDKGDWDVHADSSIKFVSYAKEEVDGKELGILRLEWQTKHACEDAEGVPKAEGSWGFFTWFLMIFFLGTAAYLIFGSWLNYNRYGARGWDLLPHGDTIRDLPYLLKDWARRVVGAFQGSGSRGGYSAV